MTYIRKDGDGVTLKEFGLVAALLALSLPLKILSFAASSVVIIIGFQIIMATAGFVVLFAVLGAVIAMPFLFIKFAWDDRGGREETYIRAKVSQGFTREEVIDQMHWHWEQHGLEAPEEVRKLRK